MTKIEQPADLASLQHALAAPSSQLSERMRALWRLRDIGTPDVVPCVAAALTHPSALLRHELCYVMGQLGHHQAIPILTGVLETDGDSMVRHEAAEAIGAIGVDDGVPILERFATDKSPEVSETCQVALDRIRFLKTHGTPEATSKEFTSVDPAPPMAPTPTPELKARLLDQSLSTFERYRALFALRDKNDADAVEAIVAALGAGSDLFNHEIAFVLGQLESSLAAPALKRVLEDESAHAMVRHEAAEALGSIASVESLPLLHSHKDDPVDVIRESCEVALEMHNYWSEFKQAKERADAAHDD
mmetsp:Transcript_2025/g.5586  ORF Transcript_2025/g.5586 Transcript_2025/m.5586 type:complete len:303 (+) Transcript_2025:76-984(+)